LASVATEAREQKRIVDKLDRMMALVDQLDRDLAVSRAKSQELLDAMICELLKPATGDSEFPPSSNETENLVTS